MLRQLSSRHCSDASVFVPGLQKCPLCSGGNAGRLTLNRRGAYNVPYSGAGSYIHVKREILVRSRQHARTTAITGAGSVGGQAATVTVHTFAGDCHLADPDIGAFVDRALHSIFPVLAVPVHAYVLQPDHLRLLVGEVTRADLPRLIGSFITLSGSLARRRFNIQLWNWRYYATFFDDAELVAGMARHILAGTAGGDGPGLWRGSILPQQHAAGGTGA